MFSIPSFYEMGTTSSDSFDVLNYGFLSTSQDNENQNLSPSSMVEARATAASNSHKEAERRRRKRINAHIATLKSILPNTIKTDKASLLSEAVRLVRELKNTTSELSATAVDSNTADTTSNFTIPTETDELKLSRCNGTDSGLIKALLCCDDRPEIIFDLIQALKSAEAKVVRAEMSTIGGRTKCVLWLRLVSSLSSDIGVDGENDVGLGILRRSLKTVMDKSTLLAGSGQVLQGQKRPRYYHSITTDLNQFL